MDERIPLSIKLITGFSVTGFLFSGYLMFVALLSNTCVAQGQCVEFLGIPVCIYGFIVYTILTALSVMCIKRRIEMHIGMRAIAGVSFLGIIFSGYFGAIELPALVQNGFAAYTLGVPTCILGLVVYMCIFAIVMLGISHRR